MSVIENALKRLQGQRPATGEAPGAADAASEATGYGLVAAAGAARRREAQGNGATPPQAVAIDQDVLRAAGMLPPAHQEHELAQQYRRIKRPLINNALGRGVAPLAHGNLIMITSAVPGEGKTFMALNLALSMRLEEDVTVLLVDGDVVNPRLTQILGLENQPGLLDSVRDPRVSASAAILPTDVPGLSFLPAGRQDANATELVASARMHEVVSKLGSDDPARLVLFDSAPLLVTTEAQALVHFAGQVVVVVRSDHTPQQVVFDALETLADDKPVSLVLNQTMRHSHAGYYYEYGTGARSREPAGNA
jgi:exopolysaccharide/PEP-CTERM locus tyrosine autokinase